MRILGYQGLMADNPLIPATYPHVFEQKSALGLVKHDLPRAAGGSTAPSGLSTRRIRRVEDFPWKA
jgi:hypothetical protein